ncbi:hypothetical protein JXC34_05680 [Candidatus Woesearchaeota archaeon]|nr:hypothetical protein [Candidatus Woesearchaeota archaeon]
MAIFSKKKKGRDKKKQQIGEILARINKLKSEIDNKKSDFLFTRFLRLMRKSLSASFNLHYEFTYEELSEDIKRKRVSKEIKDKISLFANKLIDIEYKDLKSIDKDMIKDLVSELEAIVRLSQTGKYSKQGTSKRRPFLSRIIKPQPKPGKDPIIKGQDVTVQQQPPERSLDILSNTINPMEDIDLPEPPVPMPILDIPPPPSPSARDNISEAAISPQPLVESAEKAVDITMKPPRQHGRLTDAEIEKILQPPELPEFKVDKDAEIPAKKIPPPVTKQKINQKQGPKKTAAKKEVGTKDEIKKQPAKPVPEQQKTKAKAPTKRVLPEFKITKTEQKELDIRKDVYKKRDKLKGTLTDLLSEISDEKDGLLAESERLKIKSKELEHQKKSIDYLEEKLKHKKSKLPELKKFKVDLLDRQVDIGDKQRMIRDREQVLDAKLAELRTAKEELDKLYLRFNETKKDIVEKEKIIDEKDRLIKLIKEELQEEGKRVVEEIDKFKKELSEKHDAFLKLRDHYRKREGKLSVEESNLLNEKRKYAKFIEANLNKHKELIRKDMINTESIIKSKKLTIEEVEEKIVKLESEQQELKVEMETIQKETRERREHFDRMEKSFTEKEPVIEKTLYGIQQKETNLLERENKLGEMNRELDLIELKVQKRQHELETNELGHEEHEKKIETLRIKLENKNTSLRLKEFELNKRLSSFDILYRDVNTRIRKRKLALNKLARKITSLKRNLSRKTHSTERLLEGLQELGEEIYGSNYDVTSDDLSYLKDNNMEDMWMAGGPGTPALLEVFRLLNIARIALDKQQVEEARDIYLNISNLYEQLPEEEQEEAYNETLKVFKTKEARLQETESDKAIPIENRPFKLKTHEVTPSNIDLLLYQLEDSIKAHDMRTSNQVYYRLQETYTLLPDDERARYYPRIMQLYNQVLAITSSS